MSHPSFDVHVLKPSRSTLDLACVQLLAGQIETAKAQGSTLVAIDLSTIISQTPQGLAALVELGGALGTAKVVMCGLPRSLLACAIDVGMAELFPIYASTDALRAALPKQET